MKYLRLFLCLVAISLTACMSHVFTDTTTRLQVENKTDVTILGVDIISEDGKSVYTWIRDAVEPGEKSRVVEEDWVGTFRVRVRFEKAPASEVELDFEGGSQHLIVSQDEDGNVAFKLK